MEKYIHIILTRFNVRGAPCPSVKGGGGHALGPSEVWMEKRFRIFMDYCFPSIANQSNKNFKWFVYFDSGTDLKYRDVISRLAETYDFFVPRYVPDKPAMGKGLMRNIEDEISRSKDKDISYLITTRLDNDDCLHREAVNKIQGHFHEQTYEILNFSKGYCLQLGSRMCLSHYIYPGGPFLSIIRRVELTSEEKIKLKIKGPFAKHTGFIKSGPVTQVTDNYYWIQTIHDTNIKNTLRGRLSLNKKVLSDFGIDPQKVTLSVSDYILDNARRVFRDSKA